MGGRAQRLMLQGHDGFFVPDAVALSCARPEPIAAENFPEHYQHIPTGGTAPRFTLFGRVDGRWLPSIKRRVPGGEVVSPVTDLVLVRLHWGRGVRALFNRARWRRALEAPPVLGLMYLLQAPRWAAQGDELLLPRRWLGQLAHIVAAVGQALGAPVPTLLTSQPSPGPWGPVELVSVDEGDLVLWRWRHPTKETLMSASGSSTRSSSKG